MAEQQTQEAPDTQVEETEQEQQQEQPEEQPQEPQTNLDDPILSTLWEDLGVKEPEVEEAEPEAEPEAKSAEPEAEPEKKEFSIKPKMDEETFPRW